MQHHIGDEPHYLFRVMIEFRQFGVPLEPAIVHSPARISRDVEHRLVAVAGERVPKRRERAPNMVEHAVEHHADAPVTACIDQPVECGVIAEPRIDAIVVDRVVPVGLGREHRPQQ